MKNQSATPSIKIKKEGKKENQDQSNLKGIKEKVQKEEKKESRSSLYKGIDHLSMRDQKKERSKIRRKLDSFIKDVTGKDRKKEEVKDALKKFNLFYKSNWKIQDYKMDHFSNQNDPDFRKDAEILLNLAKKELA